MELWARNNKLYYKHNRIGQVIIHTFKHNEIPVYKHIDSLTETDDVLYNIDFSKISEQLVIDKQKFKSLLASGDIRTILNLPLYSKRYFPKWLIGNSLEYIDFDLIQVEGKVLIYADGNNVRIIGQIDDETAYYLLYYGIVISILH